MMTFLKGCDIVKVRAANVEPFVPDTELMNQFSEMGFAHGSIVRALKDTVFIPNDRIIIVKKPWRSCFKRQLWNHLKNPL